MTETYLEQVTRDYILDIYKKEYIGKIKVQKLDPIGYSIHLGLSVPNRPLVIYAELEDDKFLKFLKQELRARSSHLAYYGKLDLVYPYDCSPRDTSCDCHDKGRSKKKE